MRFIRVTKQTTVFERTWLRDRAPVRVRDMRHLYQTKRGKRTRQQRRLELRAGITNEEKDLSRRLATPTSRGLLGVLACVRFVETPNAIVGKAGARANRTRACFVMNHAQRELVAAALAAISIVSGLHGRYLPVRESSVSGARGCFIFVLMSQPGTSVPRN